MWWQFVKVYVAILLDVIWPVDGKVFVRIDRH